MGLDNLDKETRAALKEIFNSSIESHEGVRKMLDYFADDKDGKGIRLLESNVKDLAESVEEFERSFAEEKKNLGAQLARMQRSIYGERGRYCGVFASEDSARAAGLMFMGYFGDTRAREALKSEYPDYPGRTLSGEVTSEGGALKTPAEVMNLVLWLVDSFGVFASKVPGMPMGSSKTTWYKDRGEPQVYVVGEQQAAETENSLDLVPAHLDPREWYSLYFYPKSLEEDSAVSLADMLARRIAWAFAYWIDKCGFMGDGTSEFKSITGVVPKLRDTGTAGIVTASGVTDFANVTDAHILSVQGLLPQYADMSLPVVGSGPGGNLGASQGAAEFYCHRRFFFGAIARLARATGGFTAEEFAGRRRLAYNGSPVNIVQVMPSAGANGVVPLIYGDIALAAMRGVRRQLTIEENRDVRWLQRQVAVMGTMRHDIVVQNVGDADTVEAMTGLKLAT